MSFFYKIKKNRKKFVFLGLLAVVILCIYQNFPKNNPEWNHFYSEEKVITTFDEKKSLENIHAKYALLMDGENGRILYEKNGYDKVAMASTTKIMTLIITLENANLEDVVTVSEYAAAQPDVQLNMKTDEQYRLKDLLYSLMLESHNDTAVAIAEHVGGSVEGFAQLMNEKAKEIGAYDTHFVTPNGLDEENHYTTAYDLALITKYALENEMFCEIIQTVEHSFHEQTTGRTFTVTNKNRFLDLYDGAIGVKTGFTGNAGYCFVGAVKKDGKTFISVVLASGWPPDKTFKWEDTKKLMDYGLSCYQEKTIVEEGISFQKIPVKNGIKEETILPVTKDAVTLLLRDEENITYDVKLPNYLEAPIKKGEKVGTMTIQIDGSIYKVLPLYAKNSCEKKTYLYSLKEVLIRYFLTGCYL